MLCCVDRLYDGHSGVSWVILTERLIPVAQSAQIIGYCEG